MAAEARRPGEQGLPRRIGRYEAFLQIGSGGMARVYLAVQRGRAGQKAELVVLKVLRPEAIDDAHVLSLFTDEARIAMRLDHPNVIRTREVIAGPPDYLLVMDFHDGRSLLEVINRLGREAVPLDEHIYVLSRVLAGLSYAHELQGDDGKPFGIVHRDVSPANVLVSYGGEVKLLDFGIAKAAGALAVTQDGVVRGKLGYAAPEQCLGQPADPRSDVYAVGVMLWEAIAGRRRVSGETWQSVMQARLDDTEPALEEVCPDAPPELVAIVRKAVARDPGDRYASATDFQIDLEKYLRETRQSTIGPARIAAMLKAHFEADRAELRRSVQAFLRTLKSGKSGEPGRIPLPGARAAAAVPAAQASIPAAPPVKEETTAPIPVDSALLMMSREESERAAELSSRATAPPPPPTVTSTSTAPPPPPVLATAPPPPLLDLTTAPPPPPPSELITTPPPSARVTAPPPPDPASTAAPGGAPAGSGSAAAFPVPSTLETLEPAPPPPHQAPVAVDPFGLVSVANVASAPGWGTSDIAALIPKKKTPVWPFLVLAAGAIGLGAVVVVPQLDSKKPPAPAVEAKTESPQPASKTKAAKVDMVNVRISVDPSDAILSLDGKELSGNPFVAELPKDGAPHELTAVAEGCKDHQQTIRLHADLAVLVAMKCQNQGLRLTAKPGARRATPAAAPRAATPPPPAAPSQAAPAGATVYPVPVAPATDPPVPAPAEPVSGDNPYK